MIELPSVDKIIRLNQKTIEAEGGSFAVINRGAIESALNPLHDPDLGFPEIVAKIMYRFIKNHPFADGNKRTAFAVMKVILKKNNYKYLKRDKDMERMIIDVAASQKNPP